jgi:hypothetical protein
MMQNGRINAQFKDVLQNYKEGRTWNKFVINDGFVFRANKLCIPASSVRLLLLQEAHGGGLMGHFSVKKTEDILATHFFWPKMRWDALHVKKLSHDSILMVYICLCDRGEGPDLLMKC